MTHLLNLKTNTVFFLWTQYGTSSQYKFCTIHLLTLLIFYKEVYSTLVESYPSRAWGFSIGGGIPRGILFQGFPKVWTESTKTIHHFPMVESYLSRVRGAYLGVPVLAPDAGVKPQQVQWSPKVWTESAKKE